MIAKITRRLGRWKEKYHAYQRKKPVGRYDFAEYKRFYHFHSRKTAGTTLAKCFLSLCGQDGDSLFKQLGQQSDRPMMVNDFVFVGWNQSLIESGEYFFGFSHIPFHQIQLPPQTFTFASFRDPAARVISHYRMLKDFSTQQVKHPCFAEEGPWLGRSFSEFLERVPREHLQNQLYMFSKDYDVDEAFETIQGLDHCFCTENLSQGVKAFFEKTGIQLPARHDRKSEYKFQIGDNDRIKLRQMLHEEYELLDRINRQSTFSKAA